MQFESSLIDETGSVIHHTDRKTTQVFSWEGENYEVHRRPPPAMGHLSTDRSCKKVVRRQSRFCSTFILIQRGALGEYKQCITFY